ncbi:hypothetical protein evm_014226 [Chilo suppressalis]|nr:hypothetical protein evm_014226 [Chilo suppressalis]
MFRNRCIFNSKRFSLRSVNSIRKQSFLTNDYKCHEAWKEQTFSPLVDKINLNDFYNKIDTNHSSKGVISAIDVDIFAHAVRESVHLDELRDLLHRLRLSAETGNMLESTHHATVRNFMEYGNIQELIHILKDPLNFGLFLDEFSANIMLNKLITTSEYEQAANVAALIMLQEDYNNDITCSLCLYACFKFIIGYTKPVDSEIKIEKKQKVEEIKIRVKFLRNPYFDDHFDIDDIYLLSGKSLAWLSEKKSGNLNINLQIIGWLCYKKYDKLLRVCESFSKEQSAMIYTEVINLMNKEINNVNEDLKTTLKKSLSLLSPMNLAKEPMEEAIKIMIENSINRVQKKDIKKQLELFQFWTDIRKQKLAEQTNRLDRAKRIELIDQKQRSLKDEEQKLWFFDNEDSIDLEIEEKDKTAEIIPTKKTNSKIVDEDYIPPEILPNRR